MDSRVVNDLNPLLSFVQFVLGLCHPRLLKVVVGSGVESRVGTLFACHFFNSLFIKVKFSYNYILKHNYTNIKKF